MKITNQNNLQHYLEGISDVLDGKARAKHRHAKVNGYSVVISDTVPTENDETIITLLVDTEYVPALSSLSIEQSGFVDYSFGILSSTISSFTTTVQALVDGAPAEAEYQFEETDGTILQRFSTSGTYRGYNNVAVNIRVRTEDMEDVFSLTFPSPTGAPNWIYSGMSQDGKIYSSQGYTAASAGYDMVYKYASGVSADEIANGEVAKIVETKQSDKEPANTAEKLQLLKESFILDTPVPLTIEEDRAYAHFQETYTEDDIGQSVEFLFTVNMTDGSVFDRYECFEIKDDPATDSFVNHIQNLRFNPTGYGTVDPDLDNIVVLTSQTSGYKSIYLKFDLDKELAYDLKVTTTNDVFNSEVTSTVSAGSTSFNSSRTVWRNYNKTISDGPHEVSIHMEGGGYEETFTLTVYVATTEDKAKAMRDGTGYAFEITSVWIGNFVNTVTTGNGQLYFTVTVDNASEAEDYIVAVIDETQGDSSLNAGTLYAGETESGNSHLWYSAPLQSGEHVIKFYLLDDAGKQVSGIYTTTLTA